MIRCPSCISSMVYVEDTTNGNSFYLCHECGYEMSLHELKEIKD